MIERLALAVAAVTAVTTIIAARPSLVGVGRLDVVPFRSRALGTTRTVRVWRPEHIPRGQRCPVLYLNDGQNLFGDGDPDSGGGGWHVDETVARLVDRLVIPPLIVVGIDHGGDRARGIDFLPVPDPFETDPDPPGADRYLQFVIQELMPFVNAQYPTLSDPGQTGFGGSSYGAVSALYAAMSHPGVFGRLLLESPSAAIGGGVLLDRARAVAVWPVRIVVGIGTGEGRGGRSTSTVQTLADIFHAAGLGDDRLKVVVQEGAGHNEAAWASRLPDALAFLYRR